MRASTPAADAASTGCCVSSNSAIASPTAEIAVSQRPVRKSSSARGSSDCAPDLVEALAYAGQEARALEVLRGFEAQAEALGRISASAAAARCAGILDVAGRWQDAFEEALALHDQVPTSFERARTELCYAERLRRARKRADARARLRSALEVFDSLGAAPWSERARAELRASGQTARRRSTPVDALTAQELAVARLVVGGATNREAASALFVSPKTIEFHLGNVYRKLAVRSRTELARAYADCGREVVQGSRERRRSRGRP